MADGQHELQAGQNGEDPDPYRSIAHVPSSRRLSG
jgi:hypothetical protein